MGYHGFDPQSAWYIAFVVKAIVKSQMSICDISNSLKSIIPHLPSHHPQYHLQDLNPLISQLLSFLACFMTNDKPLYVNYDQGVPIRMYQQIAGTFLLEHPVCRSIACIGCLVSLLPE